MTSIQNFEQTFFNTYSLLKQDYRRFKHSISKGFKILKEADSQAIASDLMKKSANRTFDNMLTQKSNLRKRGGELFEANKEIMRSYSDGVQELKKYELHPALRKENKQCLIDIYYDEQQMNKWRDSCIRGNDSLKVKFEKLEKDFTQLRSKVFDRRQQDYGSIDEQRHKVLFKKVESVANEVEPLVISMISTIFEDLKELHRNLNVFSSSDP